MANPTIVDIHTHIYPPGYVSLLRSRTRPPYLRTFPNSPTEERLVILPSEEPRPPGPDGSSGETTTSYGRPFGPEYWDITLKIAFMDAHNIRTSILSLANPWVDFLSAAETGRVTSQVNDEIDSICGAYPGRLFAFAALPWGHIDAKVQEVRRVAAGELKYARGFVMSTVGYFEGLDDPELDPVWKAIEESGLVVFLHPHYGLTSDAFGPRAANYGHVLPLALGFPMETTIALSRMILSGVWDRFPRLKVLIAHSGGTIPFLAGRLQSCIEHDRHLNDTGAVKARRSVQDIIQKNIFFDAVVYSSTALKAAAEVAGVESVMFGTDHPFFPPLEGDSPTWKSVTTNTDAVQDAFKDSPEMVEKILGGNAINCFKLS